MTRETLFMKAINEGLDQAMERDERVVLLGEDISGGVNVEHLENNNEDAWGGVMGITRGLMPKYGRERVIDTPISEHGYLSASVGMALTGLRPVPELMFNDFIGFCFDALLGQASKMRYMFGGKAKVPMVVRTMHGAGASAARNTLGLITACLDQFLVLRWSFLLPLMMLKVYYWRQLRMIMLLFFLRTRLYMD